MMERKVEDRGRARVHHRVLETGGPACGRWAWGAGGVTEASLSPSGRRRAEEDRWRVLET